MLMRVKLFLWGALIAVALPVMAGAQNFKQRQQSLSAAIKQARQKKKITETEYYKLLREQEEIGTAIEKAEEDHYFSAKEKNAIHARLQRAERRLRKYKTNREVY